MTVWHEIADRVWVRRYRVLRPDDRRHRRRRRPPRHRHADLAPPGRRSCGRTWPSCPGAVALGREHPPPPRPLLRQPRSSASAELWGQTRCPTRLVERAEAMRDGAPRRPARRRPTSGARSWSRRRRGRSTSRPGSTSAGGSSSLRHLGRGHTDNDIVVTVPDAGVLFAGDLLENGAAPYFGDGFPLDWPATIEAIIGLGATTVAPGHGEVADRAFAERSLEEIRAIADLGRRVAAGELSLDAAIGRSPVQAERVARADRTGGRPGPRRARLIRRSRAIATPVRRVTPAPSLGSLARAVHRCRLSRRGRSSGRGRRRPGCRRAPARACRGSPRSPSPARSRGRRSVARRSHSRRRASIGIVTESMPEQRHAAQDEREDRRDEGRAAGVAGCGDRRPVAQRPQHVRQRRAADRVDRAGPALRLERPAALGRALGPRARSRPRRARAGSPPRAPCRWPPRPRSRARRGSPRPCCRRRPSRPSRGRARRPGVSPRSSRATTLIAAVKPAVPMAIASRVVNPGGSGTTQSAGTRWNVL